MAEPPISLQPSLTVDGITINVPSLPEAVSSIVSAAQHGDNFSVCTLNLDHVVQLQQHANFRAAYRRARFVTADGFPIVVLSRLMGTRIERTTGADLVEPVCAEARRKGLSVFLLGANDLTLNMTARRLSEQFRGLQIAGCLAPGPGFDPYSSEADAAIETHSRLGRQALLRRAGRATAGTVRGAMPRRVERNRRVMHRGRARFHCRHAEPRAIHRAQNRA